MVDLFQPVVKLLRDRIRDASFWASLMAATAGYFTFTRLLQDWLYRNTQRPADLFASYGEKFVNPEPLEIPLYFLAYLVIPLLALAVQSAARRSAPLLKSRPRQRWVAAGGVAIVLGVALVVVPWERAVAFSQQVFAYLQTRGVGRALWLVFNKRLFAAAVVTAGTGITFLIAWLVQRRRPLPLTPPPALERGLARWGFLVVPVLALLVFHPNFPVEPHHASYFMGPVNDQLHGKPLFYATSSLYGIVSHYFLLAVFGLGILPFTYPALIALMMAAFFSFLAGLYVVLRHWLRSPTYAAAATLAVYSILYLFNTSPTRSVYNFPAMTPWRFLLVIPVFALLVRFARTGKSIARHVAVALASLAVFWNLETGLAISAATFFALLAGGTGKNIARAAKLMAQFCLWGGVFFSLINGVNFLVYGKLPLWVAYFKEIGEFARGVAMTPLPAIGLFLVLVLASLAVILTQIFRAPGAPLDLPLLFFALYGAFGMLHYVGESTWQNLFIAVWPFAVLAAAVADRQASPKSGTAHPLAVSAIWAAGFFFSAFMLVKLPVEFAHRDYRTIAASFGNPRPLDAMLIRDAEILRRDFRAVRIPLLHINDTRLLHFAGKTNWFAIYYSFPLYSKPQVAQLAEEVTRLRPPYVLVGNGRDAMDEFQRVRANELNEFFRPRLPSEYVLAEQLETLDVYRRSEE